MEQMLTDLVHNYPMAVTFVMLLGVFRSIFKPIMTAIHAIVEATPTKADDLVLDEVERSRAYKAMAWIVDYLLSIKLPQ